MTTTEIFLSSFNARPLLFRTLIPCTRLCGNMSLYTVSEIQICFTVGAYMWCMFIYVLFTVHVWTVNVYVYGLGKSSLDTWLSSSIKYFWGHWSYRTWRSLIPKNSFAPDRHSHTSSITQHYCYGHSWLHPTSAQVLLVSWTQSCHLCGKPCTHWTISPAPQAIQFSF